MKPFDRPRLTEQLKAGITQLSVRLDTAQIETLLDYLSMLAKWNTVYNLTAVRDPEQMIVQHLLDSLAVLPAFDQAHNVLDVGSGGGLPGLVLAIWARTARPAMKVAMIDTVNKKTAFLTQVKAELGLANVTVHTGRVEQLRVTSPYDVITSRAFADLADFVNWSAHLLAPGGRFIAMKGVPSAQEQAGIPAGWQISDKVTIDVPGLDAERHLVIIERSAA